ncbi:cytochrome b5-like heme/steroid binding domain-containing protein [Apiospora marii]|uniref:cytochrome b5-like heme/steroid binding domain-containing protein n=1 Tax=Apiospora marii TaxID=335849 RepID=UPI00312F2B0C
MGGNWIDPFVFSMGEERDIKCNEDTGLTIEMAHNEILEARYDYPLSPWAQRFGQSINFVWNGVKGQDHSGLAPAYPELDARYYADVEPGGNNQKPYPKPPLEDLDLMFLSDTEQKLRLAGFRTTDLGPLHETLYGDIAAGHRRPRDAQEEQDNIAAFDRGRLVIDEDKWMPWLRRDNWWNNIWGEDKKRTAPGRKNFSVDDEEVWEALRTPLELANRIMNLLIDTRHPWMVALAMGDLESDPDDPNDPTKKRIRLNPQDSEKWTVEALRARIRLMGDKHIISCFLSDRWIIESGRRVNGLWHYVNPTDDEPESTGLLSIAIPRLRCLVEGDITVAEKCMAQVALAKTFINDELSREIGRAFEGIVFGGQIIPQPPGVGYRTAESWTSGNAMIMTAAPWPVRRDMKRYGGVAAELSDTEDTDAIPLLWVSALLTEKFWATEVSKHGCEALKMPRLVRVTRTYGPNGKVLGTRGNPQARLAIETPLDSFRDRLRTTALDFNNRKLRWIERHPWWSEEGFKWNQSPWRAEAWRSAVKTFKLAHSVRDEFKAWREVETVMKQYSKRSRRSWLYWALALLMRAAMPLRDEPARQPRPNEQFFDMYARSQAALRNQDRHPNIKGTKPRAMPAPEYDLVTVPASEYEDPLDQGQDADGGGGASSTAAAAPVPAAILPKRRIVHHTDWLDCFQSWCDAHQRLDPLPRGWHDALSEAHQALLQARRDPAHARRDAWAPTFDFTVPPYDDRWQAWDLAPVDGEMQVVFRDAPAPRKFPKPKVVPGAQVRADMDKQARDFFARNPQGEMLPYLTITEVGAHRVADDAWIVIPRANAAHDVYEVTADPETTPEPAALKRMNWTTQQFRAVTIMTEHGLQMRGQKDANDIALLTQFVQSWNLWKIVGKLVVPRFEAAVRENDGTDGLPLYKTHGKDVYDLTNFACPPHWKPVLLDNPGGPIDETLPDFYPAMVSVIAKHRCGQIMDPPTAPRPEADLVPFSSGTLRWHDNPNLGVYFAIDGYVYNMTGYLDVHPGGLATLQEYAGRDASAAFAASHPADLLTRSPSDSLRIGRMVDEIPVEQLQAHHVALDKWVYDITVPEDDATGLFQALQQIGGQDATGLLNDEDNVPGPGREALATLKAYHQNRIVYRLQEAGPLPQITPQELVAHCDPYGPGAWVSVGKNVYDVTSIMLHPDWYPRAIEPLLAGQLLGGEAADDETWIQDNYPHLRVARIDLPQEMDIDDE